MRSTPPGTRSWILAWAMVGILAPLAEAVFRLSFYAQEALSGPLGPLHWAFAITWTAAMTYGEGYRVFQRRFTPQAIVRAKEIARSGGWLEGLCAPLACMGLTHAPPQKLVRAWSLVGFIVAFILVIRQFPQPWRGLVDLGVVCALSYAFVTVPVALFRGRSLATQPLDAAVPQAIEDDGTFGVIELYPAKAANEPPEELAENPATRRVA